MPIIRTKNQAQIIADYELLKEISEKWGHSKSLEGINPTNAVMYEVWYLPDSSSNGIVMWNGKHNALLSAKNNDKPYIFIEMVMRYMEEGEIVILFSNTDYEAAEKCTKHIKEKNLIIKLEN